MNNVRRGCFLFPLPLLLPPSLAVLEQLPLFTAVIALQAFEVNLNLISRLGRGMTNT